MNSESGFDSLNEMTNEFATKEGYNRTSGTQSPILEKDELNIPPPEDLIPRGQYHYEPIKSGAPLKFM